MSIFSIFKKRIDKILGRKNKDKMLTFDYKGKSYSIQYKYVFILHKLITYEDSKKDKIYFYKGHKGFGSYIPIFITGTEDTDKNLLFSLTVDEAKSFLTKLYIEREQL